MFQTVTARQPEEALFPLLTPVQINLGSDVERIAVAAGRAHQQVEFSPAVGL